MLKIKYVGTGSKACHPKMSLWHADYFEMNTIKAQKTWEETLTFPLSDCKNLDGGPVLGTEISLQLIVKVLFCKEYGLKVVGETPGTA